MIWKEKQPASTFGYRATALAVEKEMRKGAMRFFTCVEMWSAQFHLQEKQRN